MPRKPKKKIFVLDTSVILYNHNAIYSFEDNDIAIPITVLEELDHFKKGNDIKNFEAREFIRIMDKLSSNHSLRQWIPIDQPNHGHFKVCMQEKTNGLDPTQVFGENTADHRILNAVISLSEEYPSNKIVLVRKISIYDSRQSRSISLQKILKLERLRISIRYTPVKRS
jgi:PhoH-like ATPase